MNPAPRFGQGAEVGRREQVEKNVSPLIRSQRQSDAYQDQRTRRQALTSLTAGGVAAAGGGIALAGGNKIAGTERGYERKLSRNLETTKQKLASTQRNVKNRANMFPTKAWTEANNAHIAAESAHKQGLAGMVNDRSSMRRIASGRKMIRRGGALGAVGLAGLAAAVASGEHKRGEQSRFKRSGKTLTESQERKQVHGVSDPLPQWDGEGSPMRRKGRAEKKAHPNSLLSRGVVPEGKHDAAPSMTHNPEDWIVQGHQFEDEKKAAAKRVYAGSGRG